jgi:hypothetical protein
MSIRSRSAAALLLGATLILAPGAAQAQLQPMQPLQPAQPTQQAQLLDATTPELVVTAIQGFGYKARLTTTKSGKPKIESTISKSNFSIFFNDCNNSNAACKSVQFSMGYAMRNKPSPDAINAWNRDKRWAKAYLDKDGDPFLEMDVNMLGGVSVKNFEDTFDWWRLAITEFEKAIGW